MKQYNVGVIGLGQRGSALLSSMMACPECNVMALSDLYEDRIQKGIEIVKKQRGTTPKAYPDWKRLVDDPEVEVVMIICDWEMHIPMAIYAMEAHKIVGSEVAGAYSVQDCWNLVEQPMTYLSQNTELQPLSVMFNQLVDQSTGIEFAGAAIYILPALFVYLYFLKDILTGIQLTELK